ncbi:MAG: membrane protein insertase YidC [Verrucomicrobiales bacterium]|nr:membrane protein insertase YidC [Verrucomicrobiales bacterium]
MDRTSWIGVIVCIALLFTWGWWNAKETAKQLEADRARAAEEAANAPEETPEVANAAAKATDAPKGAETNAGVNSGVAEETKTLENDFVSFELTNRGAGVRVAKLKQQLKKIDGTEPIGINETAKHAVGTLSTGPGEFDMTNWTVQSATASEVVFQTTTPEGFELSKTYRLSEGENSDPHQVVLDLSVKNAAATPLVFENRYLYTGSASPLHLNEWSIQIGTFWHETNGDFEYETVDHYGGKKIMGIFGKNEIPSDEFSLESLEWAGVNDQFFATIIQPEEPYETTIWGSRFPVVVEGDEAASKKKRMFAAEAAVGLPSKTMNPGEAETLRYHIYLGPKEFSRLNDLGDDQKLVMHYDEIPIFGWLFGWAIKPLASWLIMGLVFLKGFVGNYGIAIILITIIIRLLIWPVYAKSARSMKRMSKLTPMMKELKEKYPDDPQRLNQETMKLYKTYSINPLGGCLPMFIQLPVFLAFYRMLWSAVELRHESFLWVDDLAMPDTMFMIPGLDIPFNLLPILMGVTSFIQIAITPKTGDKTQQMIFMMMPLIFLVICYNFAAALALYWTTSNAFSILQTWLMNKMPEPELKKRKASGKKSFMERMQEQADAAQKAKAAGGTASGGMSAKDRTRMPGEKGARHTKGKKKRR